MLQIDGNTQVMVRFHNSSTFGLDLYNRYFAESGTNAVYVRCVNDNPQVLLDGLKNLNIAGAITAGYETNEEFAAMVGNLDSSSAITQRVWIVSQRDGKLTGYYQGWMWLASAIEEKGDLQWKKITVVWAGSVARGLIDALHTRYGSSISMSVYNRTESSAKEIEAIYESVTVSGWLDALVGAWGGNVLVNTTRIGGSAEDDWALFTSELLEQYSTVVDVNFLPYRTALIEKAAILWKTLVMGNDMFRHQWKVCLEKILGVDVDMDVLQRIVDETLDGMIAEKRGY